jgi:hypothetical protein
MAKKAGLVVTLKECDNVYRRYKIDADDWNWCDEMFEGLVGMQSAELKEVLDDENINGNTIRPGYYEKSAMQPLEVMQRIMTAEQFKGFLLGNCIKYRMRCENKGQRDSDMYKARQYAYWLELVRQGKIINPSVDVVPEGYEFKIV